MASFIPNNEPNIALGLGKIKTNPSNGRMIKYKDSPVCDTCLKDSIVSQLKLLDQQDAIKRYVWYNLPDGITSELMERMIYYRGQVMFYYDDSLNQFVCLPYKFVDGINFYGRYNKIGPVPFMGPSEQFRNGKDKSGGWTNGYTRTKIYLENIERKIQYDLPLEVTIDDYLNKCVIIKDYTPTVSENIIPRAQLMDQLINAEAEAFPMARTALLANSGIKGLRVPDPDSVDGVIKMNEGLTNAALTGQPFIPVMGQQEFQDFTSAGTAIKSEEYLLYMQALDNYRLSLYGLKNGGLFQKKAHMLEAEQDVNDGNTLFAMQDGLDIRQDACNKINAIWGLGVWCEQAEQVNMMDSNGDGEIGDNDDTNNTHEAQMEAQDAD